MKTLPITVKETINFLDSIHWALKLATSGTKNVALVTYICNIINPLGVPVYNHQTEIESLNIKITYYHKVMEFFIEILEVPKGVWWYIHTLVDL